ncbi:hypothetical protein Scep_027552 [Stephania cephalantha]|uniref:Uncharacterized protein n=1 Tax=Stephania cephalantha TaxID=152367 RepID=A0AAP0HMM9_9MAGN
MTDAPNNSQTSSQFLSRSRKILLFLSAQSAHARCRVPMCHINACLAPLKWVEDSTHSLNFLAHSPPIANSIAILC